VDHQPLATSCLPTRGQKGGQAAISIELLGAVLIACHTADSDSDGRPAEGARKRKAPSEGKGTKVLRSLNAHKHVFRCVWLLVPGQV
jgi:hypothetical protein